MRHDDYPTALVRVVVNVDNLRIGMEAEVELTPRIEGLLTSGYLRLIGHVQAPASPLAEPLPPVEPVENVSQEQPVRRKPTKKKAVNDASSEGGS